MVRKLEEYPSPAYSVGNLLSRGGKILDIYNRVYANLLLCTVYDACPKELRCLALLVMRFI